MAGSSVKASLGVAASSVRTGEEEAAAFSLLAARVATAADRATRGISLTKDDHAVLSTMSHRLREEADAVSSVDSQRRPSPEPAGAVAAGFTVDVWVRERGGRKLSEAELVKVLKGLAKSLDEVGESRGRGKAGEIAVLFRKISALARTQAGIVGERIIGRDAEFA